VNGYELFITNGMQPNIDMDVGVSIGGRFGLSLSYPFNRRFGISSDIGLSLSYMFESITGQLAYRVIHAWAFG
jgi:hypothetical protein